MWRGRRAPQNIVEKRMPLPRRFKKSACLMIELTKMDARKMLLNEAVIETVEETPDTVVRLTTGNKYIVRESKQEILERITAFQRAVRT